MSEMIRKREDIPAQYKWNAASVYPTVEAWDAAADALLVKLEQVKKLEGKLGEDIENLVEALELGNSIAEELGKLATYAYNSQAVDTSDPEGRRMLGKMQSFFGQILGGLAFIQPEILAIDGDSLAQWRKQESLLKVYDQFLNDLFRQQAHVRSAEVEEVFGLAQDPLSGLAVTMSVLTDSEMKYPNARGSDGTELPVTQGTLEKILVSNDREARRTAWEGFRDIHLEFKNTLANNLMNSVKANVFAQRVR